MAVQEHANFCKLLKGGRTHQEALKEKYSRFDADGMPTHDADGNELADKVRFDPGLGPITAFLPLQPPAFGLHDAPSHALLRPVSILNSPAALAYGLLSHDEARAGSQVESLGGCIGIGLHVEGSI